jgi:bifunctional hydroxylase/dehydrase
MAAIAAAPRVVIAGGGPGGLATAALLRESGAIVTVLERTAAGSVAPARRAGVVLGRESWDVLRKVGGGSLLDDARNVVTDRSRLVSLAGLDDAIGRHAESLGASVRRGAVVGDVVDHGTHVSVAVDDAATGVRELLDADWFVDATGGRSPLAGDPRFRRVVGSGPMQLLPEQRSFVAVQAKAIESRGAGWTAPDGAFAINNRAEGIVGAYRGVDQLAPGRAGIEDAARGLLESLDIEPTTMVGRPYAFTARQSLATQAASGRLLLVGDSAGTVMPATQVGTSLALLDAERAATSILSAHRAGAGTRAAAAIIDDYAAQTRLLHQAYIR